MWGHVTCARADGQEPAGTDRVSECLLAQRVRGLARAEPSGVPLPLPLAFANRRASLSREREGAGEEGRRVCMRCNLLDDHPPEGNVHFRRGTGRCFSQRPLARKPWTVVA